MSIHSAGNAAPKPIQGAVNIDQTAQTKENVQNAAKGMDNVMTNIKELSQELKNQQSVKLSNKEQNSQLDTKTNQALDQLKQQTEANQKQVLQQSQSQQAQLGKGKDAEMVAQAMAGLMLEEELGDDNDIQKSLEEKMELLMKQAEGLKDVELSNPDDQAELEKMLQNLDKFQKLKGKEGQLNQQIRDLEDQLKQQEAREEMNKLPVDETSKKMRAQLGLQVSRINPQDMNQKNNEENESNKK